MEILKDFIQRYDDFDRAGRELNTAQNRYDNYERSYNIKADELLKFLNSKGDGIEYTFNYQGDTYTVSNANGKVNLRKINVIKFP